jgi:hypothetical protein
MITNIDYLNPGEIIEVMDDCAEIDKHVAFVAEHMKSTGTVIPCRAPLGFWEQWRLDTRSDILAAMEDVMRPDND